MSFRKLCLISVLLLSAQWMNAFTLNVVKTDETCTANGTLTFSVSNTTPGATIVYAIYRLPDITMPIAVQSATSLGGLVAGNYRVIATESSGSVTNTQQQNIAIQNQITTFSFLLTTQNVRCGNDGMVTVTVASGRTPYSYEIFQGPMTFPIQTSNVFSGLTVGQYSMRVYDGCGQGVVRVFTIAVENTNLTFTNHYYELLSCNTMTAHDMVITPATLGAVAYPLRVQYTSYPPVGAPIVYPVQTVASGPASYVAFEQTMPYYYGQPHTYKIQVTDACDHSYQIIHDVDFRIHLSLDIVAGGCSQNAISIIPTFFIPPYTVSFLQSPQGYNPVAGNANHPGPFTGTETYQANGHFGTYTVRITDACGRTAQDTIEISPDAISPPVVFSNEGCEEGVGGIFIYPTAPLTSVTLVSAPAQYTANPLPYHVSGYTTAAVILGSLPPGTYTFTASDACGGTYPLIKTIAGYHEINNITIIEHCGSFDINLINTSNDSGSTPQFCLQRYNPDTQQWGHPSTGVPSVGNILGPESAIALLNNSINLGFAFTGTFRVVKMMAAYGNGDIDRCLRTLKEFTFDGFPKINRIYSFSCSDGSYNVIVDATGATPLRYRIVEKDGQPFVVQNGNSYIFFGVQPGRYKFQVEDPCGNLLNSEFSVPSPFSFDIVASNFCTGQTASLIVPNFPILQYRWWKGTNTSTILSTTNSLFFSPFNSATNAGTYHVRVQYTGNPNSCLDFVLDYTVTGSNGSQAGADNAVSYCTIPAALNLNTLLTGTFDTGGNWTELSNSGLLNNNVWNGVNAPAGTYHFVYTVANCTASDQALIDVEIKETPRNLTASVDSLICNGNAINFTSSSFPNATYSWTGPNNFSSTNQNPIINNATAINNGAYAVTAAIGDCVSDAATVDVTIHAVPDFILDAKCESGRYLVSVIPVDNSFDVTAVSYLWSGPNNYSNTINPIDITQMATGDYSVTVTNTDGCDKSGSTNVAQTICFIPNVITPNNDAANDSFDLTGFDVSKLEIYNRWGRKVYEKLNYINEWHGQNMSGGILPDSTYYYIIKLGIVEQETKTGWIFLSRR